MWSKGLACTWIVFVAACDKAHPDWVILPFGEMPATGAMTGGYTPARGDLDRFDAPLQRALPASLAHKKVATSRSTFRPTRAPSETFTSTAKPDHRTQLL